MQFGIQGNRAPTELAAGPEQPIDLAMIGHFADALGADLSSAMVRRAQTVHPSFASRVGSLTALPFSEAVFDGVFSWYSMIHGDDDALAAMLREAHRVLTVDGLLLVAFQTGEGVREVGRGIRGRGFDVHMMRYHRHTRVMARVLEHCGFQPIATLDRGPTTLH